MAYQSGRNLLIAYKPEVTFGEAEDATAAKVFRPNSGGLNLAKEPIRSNENRRDGQITRGRHGSRSVAGSFAGDLSLGSYDDFIEAVFRGTFGAALTITEATAGLTSITTTTNTIVAAAGSWLTAGLRVGDVIRLSGHSTAGNNGRNLRVTGVTALTLTVAETLVADAVADTAFSIVRPKKLVMGTTPRSFTIEEREIDIDGSKLFTGNRIGQMQLQLQPNGMVIITFTIVGQNMDILEGADSPYFDAPVATVSLGMTAVEAVIRLGAEDILDVTAVDLTINLNASGVPVSGSDLTPEIFTNQATVEGSITALKKDLSRVRNFLDEDELSLHLLFTENEAGAQDFCSFFIGNLTLSGATDSELGADNGRTQQLPMMIGKDERGGAYTESTVVYQTSAA
jgi:hypothetical protein